MAQRLRKVTIYTNSSKMNERPKAGAYCRDMGLRMTKPLGLHATTFQAEAIGIIMAACEVEIMQIQCKTIVIYSDNRSMLQELKIIAFDFKADQGMPHHTGVHLANE